MMLLKMDKDGGNGDAPRILGIITMDGRLFVLPADCEIETVKTERSPGILGFRQEDDPSGRKRVTLTFETDEAALVMCDDDDYALKIDWGSIGQMDMEVLRLFGLDEEPEYSEPTNYVGGIWLNGMKLLKRWKVYLYALRFGDGEVVDAPMMDLVDAMTGKNHAPRMLVTNAWSNTDTREVHLEAVFSTLMPDAEKMYTTTDIDVRAFNQMYEMKMKGRLLEYQYEVMDGRKKTRRRNARLEPYLLNPNIMVKLR